MNMMRRYVVRGSVARDRIGVGESGEAFSPFAMLDNLPPED